MRLLKKWNIFAMAVLLCATTLGLAACQNIPQSPVGVVGTVSIDKTMVHSYHMGSNAQGSPYVLIVLNRQGVEKLNETAQRGELFNIVLDGHSYRQAAQVSSGFLVLHPAAPDWTEDRLRELLK